LGIKCDTTDINPFLVWLARAKTRPYHEGEIDGFIAAAREVEDRIRTGIGQACWAPPLHQIEKWWDSPTLKALGRAMARIDSLEGTLPINVCDLLKVAFCRTMMEHAQVSFGHQSMSFKRCRQAPQATPALPGFAESPVADTFGQAVALIASAARKPIISSPRVILTDARRLDGELEADRYSCVITSPSYPNRMSYIRELRPYMYWLGFLAGGRAAGELDWQAIGGTWGCATSNLNKWQPPSDVTVPFAEFPTILNKISDRSEILSRYVHKYFVDMVHHCRSVFKAVEPGGVIHYIVGNSKFYDVMLPVEEIFAAIFDAVGFVSPTVQVSRKRTSKKELFEFVVSAHKPV
jgi:hypothetical protein